MDLMRDVFGGMLQLPRWVFVWVNWLFALNAASWVLAFVTPDPVLTWIAVCGALAMVPNMVIIVMNRGLTKLMSLPHVPAWIALEVYLLATLLGGAPPTGWLHTYAWLVVVTNAISLAFDLKDSWAWIQGDREVLTGWPENG